jgi:hypothetical protein
MRCLTGQRFQHRLRARNQLLHQPQQGYLNARRHQRLVHLLRPKLPRRCPWVRPCVLRPRRPMDDRDHPCVGSLLRASRRLHLLLDLGYSWS